MNNGRITTWVLASLACIFLALTAAFGMELWGHTAPLPPNPLVDPAFINPATVRRSLAERQRRGEDTTEFECYVCHEEGKSPVLRYDAEHNLIIPEEHQNIVMGHGRHNRNNNCYNCHDEANLERLQTRDGRELKLVDSTYLCGSCHGPTLRDWEAGVHGRTSGYWNRALGAPKRADCVSCHNPHSPRFPGRKPAPGPHPLRPRPHSTSAAEQPH